MQNSLKLRLARLELLEDRQLLYAAAAFAQDVDRSPFNFYDAVELGDEVYFPAEDATGDVELWKSDGTEAGTLRVKDVDATDSSTPHVLAATDSKVFFSAYETQRGRELWATDGTEEGTQLVADLQVGSVGFFDSEFGENLLQVTAVGEQIYFANNSELWISDGTATGTTLLRDTGERIRNLTTLNGKAYFHLDRELWESDGSTEGTKSLVSIGDEALPFFTELVASGESLYLSSGQSLIQYNLNSGATNELQTDNGSYPVNVVKLGDSLIVHTRGSSNEDFLYNVTGDQIDELYAFGYSGLSNLIVSGDEVVFEVSRQQSVWGTDGTAAGTRKTGDIPTGSNGRGFSSNGKVYSSFRSGGIGIELSVLDLAADQRTILDINPGRSSSYAAVIRGDYGGDTLLWTANAGLWATDGTSVGTRSLNTEISGPGNRNISNVTNTDNGIVFLSRAIDGDRTAWKSDGIQSTALTAETPLKFEPCIDGSLLGCVRPTPTFTQFRDTTYVLASEQSSFKRFALWEVDDVSGEIQRVSTPEGLRFVGVDYIKVIGEQMYFVATTETGFREVWTTDGTTDGWQMLLQVEEDGSTELEQIVELNGEAYFIESRFSEGRTLWKTDGTVAGTEPVDVFPNPPRVPRFDVQLYEASDQLFAIAEAENGNVEVYRIDGSPGGAVQVVPDAFGGMRLLRFSAAVFGNELIFQRDTETGGSAELWITDGSLEGTRHILDASDDGIRFIGSAADQFYFALDNESLWVTDGTKAGTTSISDVAINSWDLASYATDDGIFFAGTSDESGSELWFSDGTAEGTHEFADILPGPLGSEPSSITSVDGMLLVGVNDDGFGGGVVEIPLLEKSPMPGDADGNGAVEFADFLILSSNFGKNADAAFADGDFNEDGKVNFNDFLLLSTNFGR